MSTPRRQKRADDFQRVAKQIYRHWRTKSLAAFEVYLYNAAYPKEARAERQVARENAR